MHFDLKTSVYFKICKTLLFFFELFITNNKYNTTIHSQLDDRMRWNFYIISNNLKANN